ncbi:bifunctional tRNA (5-methylaminomethyl-2-thiouridine)(34)-methyltransferase MnmD/FAD-dependent 5-carboxymethylaminomethyl-2-thiouridine(34) oxidoreductase MnmC [Bowmanella denitrificans]|uniref:bifunctional tRNA (5-methylaminomethyl-2-thiouridine)(34)-methyltransferase MnmD/FAD-dependent 5-carboxymethylaminomethyl-2-thiouridine(34) oxidoreductase MnmC n=1 Tax=Bowmanella denitrificans TaxID=366582 RepID=UPI000C9CF397|nr:bifunctional tRNA (5-methylaminomethyl-2-thiouridine)(34)-methyltransferase MnmD/FAD-dependent 5-carboxymethylaminomethyl-2-thiouridine(34) oxidoreductase MnmC [Bowmanella denitrificans]
MAIQTAQIDFNEQGTPVANAFDDVYFSNANGLEETRYVFLHNNQIPQRWQQWQNAHFIIAETGFGTGLNFLASLAAFADFRVNHPSSPLKRLYFISTEKFPLSQGDLQQALNHWPVLAEYSQALLNNYPHLTAGCHRLLFTLYDADVVLDLWLGDLHELLVQWHCPPTGLVDAWFLDGFAPSKNPDMWTEQLFTHMATLGKQDCTFATFTAAGFVRRGLQQAGFAVEKRQGFGHKRDMLAGYLPSKLPQADNQPWYFRRTAAHKQVAIIGAGLAGANLAYSLCQKGYQVCLYSKAIADGASGNRQGGFYPQLHVDDNLSSRFMAQAFGFARRRYAELLTSQTVDHDFCGVLQIAFNAALKDKQQKLVQKGHWPANLLKPIDSRAASDIAGLDIPYPALFIQDGGWLDPAGLTQALLQTCGDNLQIIQGKVLEELVHQDGQWQLHWQDGSHNHHPLVVLATGAESVHLPLLHNLPLRPVRGQVEHIPSLPAYTKLKTVLCHKGYMTPALNGRHAMGSTYIKQDMLCDYRSTEAEQNLAIHQQAMAGCDWAGQLITDGQGRASVRLGLPDHLPLVGAMPDLPAQSMSYANLYLGKAPQGYAQATDLPGLYLLMGLGSRGLCTAPLLAEMLASQLAGEPLPLDNATLAALSPNRFLIRDCQRKPASNS